jgi:probable phosphoglycerate mutase
MTEIWVVRHGETPWNTVRRVQGWEDIELNEIGISQAHALGRHLAANTQPTQPIEAIYSSDLKRAHQTANIIAGAIGLTPQIETGVRERNFGVLQGLIFNTMHEHQPEAAKIWASRDPHGVIPEGETLGTFHSRVVKAIDEIATRHAGKRVMVVSHGGAMDIIWRHASQVSLQEERKTPIVNTSVNRILVSADGWKIIDWGDVSHLKGASRDDVTI